MCGVIKRRQTKLEDSDVEIARGAWRNRDSVSCNLDVAWVAESDRMPVREKSKIDLTNDAWIYS